MSITLHDISLPDDLWWEDEFSWSPTASTLEYSLAGAALVETSQKLAGRPITLVTDPDRSWVTRATVEALKALADQPGLKMMLAMHGTDYTVIFAPGEKPFDAESIWAELPVEKEDEWVITTLRLMEVT